ncbi:MAG: class I SAM-dependent methyltransferase [Halodesulfurarchaeum sp.]
MERKPYTRNTTLSGNAMTGRRFDPEAAEKLESTDRFRYLSRDELISALDVEADASVLDLGSGTGFYTREVAAFVGSIHAIDLQPEMHEAFGTYGIPDNVCVVSAMASSLPFRETSMDGAYSTMTYHEYEEGAMRAVYRVLTSGGTLVVVDWSKRGEEERGPPLSARFLPEDAAESIRTAGFDIERVDSRPETFLIVATKP